MRFVLWTLTILVGSSSQLSHPNCLRSNPGVLGAVLSLANNVDQVNSKDTNITKEDVATRLSLLSTRFHHVHIPGVRHSNRIELIEGAVPLLTEFEQKNLKLFVKAKEQPNGTDVNELIRGYRKDHESVKKINSIKKDTIIGLYLHEITDTFEEELEAVESVFPSNSNSILPVGIIHQNCSQIFGNKEAQVFLRRMDFITCSGAYTDVFSWKHSTPDELADDVVSTCAELQTNANSINVMAKIRCVTFFHSFGVSFTGVVGSVLDFQRFWCRIVGKLIEDKSLPEILLLHPFDFDLGHHKSLQNDSALHTGWWRRSNATSSGTNGFVEKVNELEGGTSTGSPSTPPSTFIANDSTKIGSLNFLLLLIFSIATSFNSGLFM